LGIVTTSSETAFSQSAETIYDFVTNPVNWTKTYPHSVHIGGLPDTLPLKVGDTWTESGPDANRWDRYRQGALYPYVATLIVVGAGGMQAENIAIEGLKRGVAALDDLDTVGLLVKSL
jgi:hypothetical protein